jgi:hypothetical protein
MLVLRACPHCHGDLALEQDRRCTYLECVQCGHVLSLAQEKSLGIRTSRRGLVHYTSRQSTALDTTPLAARRRAQEALAR